MNNFWTRTLTGAVFLVVMVGGIIWNFWSYIALFSLIPLLGVWEFYSLMKERISLSQKIAGTLLGLILLLASGGKYFVQVSDNLFSNGLFIIILIFPLFLIVRLFRPAELFTVFSPVLFGILYVIFPFCFLLLSFSSESYWNSHNNSNIILGFFFLIWSNDTFAYLVGRSFGKTKLFERVSPKKTWEGTIGGVICTQGIAYILSIYFTELAIIQWMVVAAIVSVFGTLGDLVESMFKRSLGVKDSGNILPGHGGILDRFDGVLLSSPFVMTYLMLVR
ncbi:MAG: phosphatidate cytidylyltransferase [Bacteroidetes bacterium]|nr:phosphatidate cytidylyltransferase [Bacteroidota bacterium]